MMTFHVKPDLSDCAASPRHIASIFSLRRPAGKRDNIAPAGRAGLGAGPVHDRLRRKHGILHHLGSFATAEEAGAAYLQAAHRLFGEFARAS